MKSVRQCAILVGGKGTRLGQLTSNSPKPLLRCGDRPFLSWVLRELSRFGIEDVVLLAGYKSDSITAFCDNLQAFLPKPMLVRLSTEPVPAGTGGALKYAADLLDETFLLLNGDSWTDTNLVRFLATAEASSDPTVGVMLARKMDDCSRYGTVSLDGDRVVGFCEKQPGVTGGIINCGIYVLSRSVLDFVTDNCSLEQTVLPALAARGLLSATVMGGYFIDIGIPSDYERVQTELPARLHRPAVFLDRDGVLNVDYGWVGYQKDFQWVKGAREAVGLVNEAGFHAFVVTNQAGVAKGRYDEQAVTDLHRFICDDLRRDGYFIDDIRYCPYHPEALIERYRAVSDWRKPAPGMLADLAKSWEVDMSRSLLIGDKESDLETAQAAGIPGHLFSGDRLDAFLGSLLPRRR